MEAFKMNVKRYSPVPKHHAIKGYRGHGGKTPYLLNHISKERGGWSASFFSHILFQG
jgi:hypothetical protein